MKASKIQWTKAGGHEGSRTIIYSESSGVLTIMRTCITGYWTRPCLYRDGKYVSSHATVKAAKAAAETLMKSVQ